MAVVEYDVVPFAAKSGKIAPPCMGASLVAWQMSICSTNEFVHPETVRAADPVIACDPIDASRILVPAVGVIDGVLYVVAVVLPAFWLVAVW